MKRLIIFIILLLLPLYAHAEVMHYYMNDNAASTVVIDSSASAVDGTLAGGDNTSVLAGTGKVRGCLNFNGTDDVVDANQTLQTTFAGSFSISAWIRPDDGQPAASSHIVGVRDASPEDKVLFYVTTSGGLQFLYESNNNDSTGAISDPVFDNGQETWHHVVAVADSTIDGLGGLKLYCDGAIAPIATEGNTSGVTFADFVSANNLYIGARNKAGVAEQFFAGDIDDVRVLNTALTANEVTKLYYNGRGTETALADIVVTDEVAHFYMDDNAADTVVKDSSDPIGNDGVASFDTDTASIAGIVDTALDFVIADTDLIAVDSIIQTVESNAAGAISFWAKITDDNLDEVIFSISNNANATVNEISFFADTRASDKLTVLCYQDGTNQWTWGSGNNVLDPLYGNWAHITLTHNGTVPNFYINGAVVGSATVTTDQTIWMKGIIEDATNKATVATMGTLMRNGAPVAAYYDGGLDDVRVYSSTLSAGEVSAIYEGGRGTQGSLNHATVGSGIGIKCGASAGSN